MRKKIFIIVLCCIAVLLAGYVGYRSYNVWKCNHLMRLAHEYLANSDERNALLCVQQVLRSDPHNLDATRVMAQLTEAARSPSALLWRALVVQLNPHSLMDRLALAQTAMIMGDYVSATNSLGGVDPADKNTAAYQNEAGAVAAAINQPAQAEEHFLEASKLDPQSTVPQLNLAVVRLHDKDESIQAEAKIALQRFSSNPTNADLRCRALRELTTDALNHHQEEKALAMSKRLLAETNSVFSDRLLRLNALRQGLDPEFKPALAAYQREAAADPKKIYALAMWQMTQTSPQDALVWLRNLPAQAQTNQPVALLTAECRTMLNDWPGLQSSLEQQNWSELEFMRHAFLSQALRAQGLAGAGKVEWEQAYTGAKRQLGSLKMLLNLAAQWHLENEGEDILANIVNLYPGEQWAKQSLEQALYLSGQTRSLMQFYSQEIKRDPSNITMKNNLAMMALLLDAQELKPYQLATEVYQKSPTNSAYISTYAFSLYLRGKNVEALKLIEQLKPSELEDPDTAGYYGLILKATNNRAKANTYLDLALKAHLLPEETKLFETARTGI